MTLLLQYNVNNHILDGTHYMCWPVVFLDGEFAPIENAGYASGLEILTM